MPFFSVGNIHTRISTTRTRNDPSPHAISLGTGRMGLGGDGAEVLVVVLVVWRGRTTEYPVAATWITTTDTSTPSLADGER
jgi:hypothetical protein